VDLLDHPLITVLTVLVMDHLMDQLTVPLLMDTLLLGIPLLLLTACLAVDHLAAHHHQVSALVIVISAVLVALPEVLEVLLADLLLTMVDLAMVLIDLTEGMAVGASTLQADDSADIPIMVIPATIAALPTTMQTLSMAWAPRSTTTATSRPSPKVSAKCTATGMHTNLAIHRASSGVGDAALFSVRMAVKRKCSRRPALLSSPLPFGVSLLLQSKQI
jgi:hypothetical protein